ncbi:3-oxoacyl-ACP reductase [Acrocarpospora pleiomorpha]|uniref:3-oxoacyl-ACP reductase n=1 Tax=Acrocarpospora pleiomorpha TaxID=90975 RepID=A0A5M3XUQ4_9ACTN|nr:SDR family oxidoreductase [Acrocarpospora pleiomorpha]GES24616.1 3-oxoacyl-ACP reductase [Acrocarpospora pleiomorpha]
MADFGLNGYRVIVTGASRGIGRGIAKEFAAAGAAVSICGRKAVALDASKSWIEERVPGAAIHTAVCDLSDEDAVELYIEEAARALGGIDVLVNNASGFGRSDDEDGWGAAIRTDLMGTLRASWAALPWLRRSGSPSLIHITSTTAYKPSMIAPAYAAIKAALVHYTKSQAKKLAVEGIRVNSVAPGPTTAPGHFYEKRKENNDPGYQRVLADSPAGRLGQPEDIANVVLFLASPAAAWVQGQTIVVDGGHHLFDNS